MTLPIRLLRKIVDVRPPEVAAMLWSAGYFFCLLCSYYMIRPVRDAMGIAGGVRNLEWMYTGTLIATFVAILLFSAIVARYPRRVFMPVTYHFFALNLLVFYVLMIFAPEGAMPVVAQAFFVWVSVFVMLVVAVFWAFMVDVFASEQGKRLFGFIAAGGSLGALVGSSTAAFLADSESPLWIGHEQLLLIALVLLEGAILCMRPLGRRARSREAAVPEAATADPPEADEPGRGTFWDGIVRLAQSPYLLGIGLFIVLQTAVSTFAYMMLLEIVEQHHHESDARTAVFARIDLAVTVLTLVVQALIIGRVIRWIGLAATLAVLPMVAIAGFSALAAAPVLVVIVLFEIVNRAFRHAVSKPSREVLFTSVTREEKYMSKPILDTLVYRGGDAASAWVLDALRESGATIKTIAAMLVPVALVWAALAVALGFRHRKRIAEVESAAPMEAAST